MVNRCRWVPTNNKLYCDYHDKEWGKPLVNNVPTYKDVPSSTDLSQQIAKNLKKRGFKFLGPTTIYSFLQAPGFVNDHENNCDFK